LTTQNLIYTQLKTGSKPETDEDSSSERKTYGRSIVWGKEKREEEKTDEDQVMQGGKWH